MVNSSSAVQDPRLPFLKEILEVVSPFCGATDTPVLDLCDLCLGYQSQGGSLTCILRDMCAVDSSDSPLL